MLPGGTDNKQGKIGLLSLWAVGRLSFANRSKIDCTKVIKNTKSMKTESTSTHQRNSKESSFNNNFAIVVIFYFIGADYISLCIIDSGFIIEV